MDREHDASNLLKTYLNIANGALSKQQDDPVLQGIVTLLQHSLALKTLSVTVIDDQGQTLGSFSTRFAGGRFAPIESDVRYPDIKFQLEASYLQAVADNADDYMANPSTLNWDWLTGRVQTRKDK
jgi:hypothetical protein